MYTFVYIHPATLICVAVVSAPAGLVIGGGYLVLDQTGFLSPHLKQTNYQRPICPQDNTQIQTPYKY